MYYCNVFKMVCTCMTSIRAWSQSLWEWESNFVRCMVKACRMFVAVVWLKSRQCMLRFPMQLDKWIYVCMRKQTHKPRTTKRVAKFRYVSVCKYLKIQHICKILIYFTCANQVATNLSLTTLCILFQWLPGCCLFWVVVGFPYPKQTPAP